MFSCKLFLKHGSHTCRSYVSGHITLIVFTHPGTLFPACVEKAYTTCNLFIYMRTCCDQIWQQKVGGEETKQTTAIVWDIGMANYEKRVEQEAAYPIPISLYNCYRTVRHEKRYQEYIASLLLPHCPVTVVYTKI